MIRTNLGDFSSVSRLILKLNVNMMMYHIVNGRTYETTRDNCKLTTTMATAIVNKNPLVIAKTLIYQSINLSINQSMCVAGVFRLDFLLLRSATITTRNHFFCFHSSNNLLRFLQHFSRLSFGCHTNQTSTLCVFLLS